MPSIASSATSVLIAHVGAQTTSDPARCGRRHAAQPLPAGHRRAVRHAGRDAPGPDRSRPRPGAGLGPEHHVRAAPRPGVGRHGSRRTSWSCRPTSQARHGSPASTPSPARARTCRCTSWGRRCSAPTWRPRSACPTRSPSTSHRRRSRPPSPPTAASSGRRRSSTARTSSPASTSSPRTPRPRPQEQLQTVAARPGDRRCSGAGARFTDEEADLLLEQAPAQHVDQMLTYSAVGTPPRSASTSSGFAQARRRRRADRRPPVAHHRGPAAIGQLLAEAMRSAGS